MSLVLNPFTGNFDEVSDLTVTVGASPNANASTVTEAGTAIALVLQPANTSFPGVLLAADWNTFNNKQPAGNYITALTGDVTATGPGSVAATLATVNANVGSFTLANITVNAKGLITAASTTATGNLTDAGTDGIVITGGTNAVIGTGTSIAQHVSDTTHNGYLSSTDWNTFNGKQPAGNYITALTGDATATGPGSVAITLATVNANVGSFSPAAVTVNAKGLVTAASNVTTGNLTDAGTDGITITGGTGAVLGTGTSISQHVADTTHNGYLSSTDWNTFNGKQAAGNYITALTGDVTASGPGSAAATLATVNANVGSFGTATQVGSFTVNAKGLVTAASNTSIQITESQVTNLTTDLAGKLSTTLTNTHLFVGNGSNVATDVAASGDLTLANTGAFTFNTVNSNVGSFTSANITVNAKGLVTAAANGTAPNISVVSKTTTYSASATDGLILCSGSAFTVTLPTAVGNTGANIRIKKTDSSLTNIITINTTSSQTIDGATSTGLNTQYEELIVCSDGSNWQVLTRYIASMPTSYTPTFVGLGTVTNINVTSERTGHMLRVWGGFTSGTATATTMTMTLGFAGTDNNVTSDGSFTSPSVFGSAVFAQNQPAGYIISNNSSATIGISLQGPAGGGQGLSFINGNSIGNNINYSINFTIPISGWRS